MSLPILPAEHGIIPADLERLFHRTGLYLGQQLGESTNLDCGTAIANAKWPAIADANHVWDASLAPDQTPQQAASEANAHFGAAGGCCGFWVLNPAEPASRTQPLADYLLTQGWQPRAATIYYLRKAPPPLKAMGDGLMVIPARASYRHAHDLALCAAREADPTHADALAAATMARLDDPHWDAILALQNGQPVAHIGVLSIGDMGRIDGLFVHPDHRRKGLAKIMLARAMEVCIRSVFRHVFAEIGPDNAPAVHLARTAGFEPVGSLVRLMKPA
jgi:GNAT superfamily N-acetyltransferase